MGRFSENKKMKKITKSSNLILSTLFIINALLPASVYAASKSHLRVPIGSYSRINKIMGSIARKGRIPTRFVNKSTGEKLTIVRLNKTMFKKYRTAISNIAEMRYDKSPVEILGLATIGKIDGYSCYTAKLGEHIAGYIFAYKEKNKLNICVPVVEDGMEGKEISNTLIWVVAREAQNNNIAFITVKGVSTADKYLLEYLRKRGFTTRRRGANMQGRVDIQAPVPLVLKKTSEILNRNLVIDKTPVLLQRIGTFLNAARKFL